MESEQQILSAFGRGQAISESGGYRSDCPHDERLQPDQFAAWHLGFDENEGPVYRISPVSVSD